MTSEVLLPIAIPIVIVLVWLFNCLNILREYERAVVFRLGRVLKKDKGPGLVLIFWPIDKIVKVSLRVVTWDIPPQDVITRDNVSLKVNAVVYFRVISATKAIIEVEVGDDAVLHGLDGHDVAWCAPQHFFGFFADRFHLVGVLVQRDDGRFVDHDALAARVHQCVGRPQIDRQIAREHAEQGTKIVGARRTVMKSVV